MTDKQKEAIETLFHLEHVNGYVDLYEKHDVIIKSDILLKWKNATKEVLNLIQTQQAEIDSLKDFKEIAESKVTDLTPIGLARTNQLLSRQCHKLQEENEKKDKMIDEMAKWLNEDDTSFGYGKLKEVNTPKKIKQYFERKVTDTNVGERKVENGR